MLSLAELWRTGLDTGVALLTAESSSPAESAFPRICLFAGAQKVASAPFLKLPALLRITSAGLLLDLPGGLQFEPFVGLIAGLGAQHWHLSRVSRSKSVYVYMPTKTNLASWSWKRYQN
jgi:hypothetical protein